MSTPTRAAQCKPSDDADGPMPAGCTNFKLRQLMRRVRATTTPRSASRPEDHAVLAAVACRAPRPDASGDLARAMKIDASTLTRNLQPLVEPAGPTWGRRRRAQPPRRRDGGRAAKRAEAQRHWRVAQRHLTRGSACQRSLALHALIDECLALLEPEAEERR